MQYISETLCFNWPALVEQIVMNFRNKYRLVGGKEEYERLTAAIRDAVVNLIRIEIEDATGGSQGFNQTGFLKENVYDALFEHIGISVREGDTLYNFVHEIFYDYTDFYYTIIELSNAIEEKGIHSLWRVSVVSERIDILEIGDIRILQWETLTHRNGVWCADVYEAARKASQWTIDSMENEEVIEDVNAACLAHPMVNRNPKTIKPSWVAEMDILRQLRNKRW
jgi:hypothetical protein